jgi:two-component system phosphate regulon sensor histidine kinase PhoR
LSWASGLRGKLFQAHLVGIAVALVCAELFLPGLLRDELARLAGDPGKAATLESDVRWLLVLISVAGIGWAGWVSIAMGGEIARATRALTRTAEAMAGGNLGARTEWAAQREFLELGRAIHQMGDQLAQELGQLRGDRDRLNAILGSMTEGVLVLDSRQRITLANPSVRRVLGLPASDARGPPTLLDLQRLPALHALAEEGLRGQRQTEEISLIGGRQVLVRAAPLSASTGEQGALLVFYDLTEIRRLEAVRRDFVANASHELRTPLAAIRGYAETLLDGALQDPVRAQEFLGIIHHHAERLAALLDDLLSLSRLEAGSQPLAHEPVALGAVARRALDLVQPKAGARGVAFQVQIAPEMAVMGDAGAVEQILVNLLDNAVKYSPGAGEVRLRAEQIRTHSLTEARADSGTVAPQIRVLVEDAGVGIEPRHLSRVFERFYRVDSGRSRDLGGTGLGLSIVKHLTQAMGGKVGVDSEVGRGSTFWFELPAV